MSASSYCLIVEDSDVVRDIAVSIVEGLGVACDAVPSGAEGVAAVGARRPDVVLLDWNLPSMGAVEFLRALRGFEAPRPEVILCAADYDPQQFALAKAAGAKRHILKPLDRDSVEAAFREISVV